MLFNYFFSIVSVLIIFFVIKDIYTEIRYIRKDIENLIDENIKAILYDEIDEIKIIKKEDNL